MAALSVTTTPQAVPGLWVDIQNLGQVDIWVDYSSTVSPSTGAKVAPGGVYTRPWANLSGALLYVRTTSGTADVRVTTLPS